MSEPILTTAGAPPVDAAPADTESPSEQAPAPSPRDIPNDLMSVLLAATGPLTLHAIQDELNAPGRGEHVPTGPIERLLSEWAGSDRARVAVTKLGDPLTDHYQLSPAYRAEVESPGLVIEKRAAILGAALAYDALCVDAQPVSERPFIGGCPANELDDLLRAANITIGWEELDDHVSALVAAGLLVVENGDEHNSYVLQKGVAAKLITMGAPALAKTTLPKQEDPPPSPPPEPAVDEQVATIKRHVDGLNLRLEEERHRSQHFQAEALRFAQRAAKYEQWARKGGFNIAEITGHVDAIARDQGVPWVVLRIVDETELRRLLAEEDKLNEALAAAKKSFDSAKRAYDATKAKLEEKLALVKQAQRSPSYAPDKMVRRIVRGFRVEVVSDDAHDYGMHLDWEELREEDREEAEPEVVVPEPPPLAPPVTMAATPAVTAAPTPTPAPAAIAAAEAATVVQVPRRETGTTAVVASEDATRPFAEDRRLPPGKRYEGKISVKDLADPLMVVFLNEEYGIRLGDVRSHFEAQHGTMEDNAAKLVEPTLRFLEGRGSLRVGDIPGATPTSDPVRLYWHASFKDPRTASPPTPPQPAEKGSKKAKDDAATTDGSGDAAEAPAKAKRGSKKKAAAK